MTDIAPRFRQGAGRLCLDFIRTLRHRGTAAAEEELPDRAALDAWLRQFGLPMAAPHETADEAARALREAVHELIAAARGPAGTGSASAAARNTINDAAARPVPAPAIDGSGALRWHAPEPGAAALALLARDALDLVTSPAIGRVRECANPDCKALFVDGSRPGTRRWCSMSTCGNKAKKQTLRGKAN